MWQQQQREEETEEDEALPFFVFHGFVNDWAEVVVWTKKDMREGTSSYLKVAASSAFATGSCAEAVIKRIHVVSLPKQRSVDLLLVSGQLLFVAL